MSKVSVFDHGWIDLVFEGRNQSYGAYQLRRQDSRTTILALISGIALMGAIVTLPLVINYFQPEEIIVDDLTPVLPEVGKIYEVTPLELPKPKPAATEPAAQAPARSTATQAHTALVATSRPVTTVIPTTAQLLTVDPGANTNPGNPAGTLTGPSTLTTPPGTGTGEGPVTGTGVETSLTVDKMPAFPGGIDAFYEQVVHKFSVPELETSRTFKVYVSFVVETDGSMSNIKVGRDPGYGMAAEAVRVLKSIKTKWAPGQKKGQAVRTAYNLPIVINVK